MTNISIVIVTFNSIKFIKPCLDSVFNQEYRDFEVMVVDNGSRDNTISLIKKNYPTVKLIENKENLGACIARNQGIKVAQGEWVLTLDCDIILEKDFINKIMQFVKGSEESIGIFQPKILQLDKKTIYSCGIYLSNLRRFYDIGKGKPDNGQFNKPRYVFGACSAAALYKRQMLEEIKENTGYFDERFFFLVEDLDLAWRAQRKDWKAMFYPEAVCYHYGNSSRTSKEIKQYLCFRNRYLMLSKNDSKNIIKLLSFIIYDIPRIYYLLCTNRYVLKALREVFKNNKNTDNYFLLFD